MTKNREGKKGKAMGKILAVIPARCGSKGIPRKNIRCNVHYELRKERNKKRLKFDLKKGIDRVLRLVFDEYWAWRGNEKFDE